MKDKRSKLNNYVELTKPKVTLLNLLVGITCFALASFPSVDWYKLALFSLMGYMAAGGCGALNCVLDRDIDMLMSRTSSRAIPSGDVDAKKALIFGILLIAGGLVFSYFLFNPLTALMIVLGIIFYLPVYTVLLKRSSPLNVIIGGAAGCFAGLSGWTAVANSLTLAPLLISALDFLWTPGHLWGLAIKRMSEYKKAGIPMLPVSIGIRRAGQVTFLLNISTMLFSLLPAILGFAGLTYGILAVSVGGWFVFESRRLLICPSEAIGFRVFLVSMPYLAILMAGLLLDRQLRF
jgi:heme o synthase